MPQVTITLVGQNFNYEPGYLQVHAGNEVQFVVNQVQFFLIKFAYGTPFKDGKTQFSPSSYSGTIDTAAAHQIYHYQVVAVDNNGVHLDGGCPSLDVL